VKKQVVGSVMVKFFDLKTKKMKGQSCIEYAVLLTALCLVFLTMFLYMQRSANAKLFIIQNQLNLAVR